MTSKLFRFIVQWKGSKVLVSRQKTLSSSYSFIRWFRKLHGEVNASQLEIYDGRENKII